jgi:hypothetical protein
MTRQTWLLMTVALLAACADDGSGESNPSVQLEDTVDVAQDVAGDAAPDVDIADTAVDVPVDITPDVDPVDAGDITGITDTNLADASDAVELDVLPDAEVVETPAVYVTSLSGSGGTGAEDDPYHDLQEALDAAPDGATVFLEPGTYNATPVDYADPGCGNCDDFTFYGGAEATRGFLVTGKSLHIQGGGRSLTILVTGAGYGLLFDEAGSSSVQALSITGGVRDADGKATDAGIVVRMTELLVEDVAVVANDDLYTGPLPDPVVGIGGIFGREGSTLTVRHSIIEDNSWDGITLYRGLPGDPTTSPSGTVEWCRIGASGFGTGGRGAGLAATWDSSLVARYNVIHHYWKGIGAFGNTYVEISHNVIRDQLGWGVIASGESQMSAMNNVIARNGTTGLAAWNAGVTGVFVNNLLVGNGTSLDEWVGKKTGLWYNVNSLAFVLAHNLAWDNEYFDACSGGYPEGDPCQPLDFDGVDGNVIADPAFVDMAQNDWHLGPGSAALDTGAAWMDDNDGSPCDMGLYGGPDAPDQPVDGPGWTP